MDIKLLIWDLDDTLWSGTLAERDDVVLFQQRAAFVRELNKRGIVSAIASKNDFDQAKTKLQEFGLWDEFVFRRIAFSPKGEAVKAIIEDMNLQAKHVLFIDDNQINLHEVKHLLPDINIVDSNGSECDALLDGILAVNGHINKSRVEEYRSLDDKISDRIASGHSPEDFLKSCDIRVCMVNNMDNLDFVDRIEELINRTNQLNFLKSRVQPGSMADYMSDAMFKHCYAVFVWDKYGYHGLVGFAAVENGRILAHFAFSCRVMHMGVEQWTLAKLIQKHPPLNFDAITVQPGKAVWLTEEDFSKPPIRKSILERETQRSETKVRLRIMANCQSGALAHFSQLGPVAEFDNMPRFFNLSMVLNESYKTQYFPEFLVYGPFSDYWDIYWPEQFRGAMFFDCFERCAAQFAAFLETRGVKMIILLPPDDAGDGKYATVARDILLRCNNIWRVLADQHDGLSIFEVSEIANADELIDARHFTVSLLKKLADVIAKWFQNMSAAAEKGGLHAVL